MTQETIRKRKLIAGALILLICGVLYYCLVKTTGFGIPCLFRLVTGLKCPGCGISTMMICVIDGDISAAFEANRFLFITSPLLLFELSFAFYLSWNGKRQPKWNEALLILYVVALLAFGVLRNLPGVLW